MQEDVLTAGELEIRAFLPPDLLQGRSVEGMTLDEFAHCLGMARYVEDMWTGVLSRAIAQAFAGPDE